MFFGYRMSSGMPSGSIGSISISDILTHTRVKIYTLVQTFLAYLWFAMETKSSSRSCAVCASTEHVRWCAQCVRVVYCSRSCQKKHWRDSHRLVCVPVKAAERWDRRNHTPFAMDPERSNNISMVVSQSTKPLVLQAILHMRRTVKGDLMTKFGRDSVVWSTRKKETWPKEDMLPMSDAVTCRAPIHVPRDLAYLRPQFLGVKESVRARIAADTAVLHRHGVGWLSHVGPRIHALVRGLHASTTLACHVDPHYESMRTLFELKTSPATDDVTLARIKRADDVYKWGVLPWSGSDFHTLVPRQDGWHVWEIKEAIVRLDDCKTTDFLVSEITWGGAMQCPLQSDDDRVYYGYDYGNRDWVVTRRDTGERVFLPSLTVHLMLCHGGFCQGVGMPYRVEPGTMLRALVLEKV